VEVILSELIRNVTVLIAASACTAAAWTPQTAAPKALFSAADAYERFMGRWSRLLAPNLVTIAGVRDGETILDVGSGTGALTVAAAAAAPSSRIVGIDVTEPYVAYARARHSRPLIAFEVGDAQTLRFATSAFDRTLSLLVVNFIPDPARALDEMIRVTKPGGTVTAAVWDYGHGMEMLRAFWDEAIAIRPDLDARDERHQPLCRRGELGDLWRQRGLLDVKDEALTIVTTFASFDDYWLPFLEQQGPAGAFVAALSEVDRDRLRDRLRRRLLGDGRDRRLELTARAWVVHGTVAARPPQLK
jgi:SAM-dependent methyltransferase